MGANIFIEVQVLRAIFVVLALATAAFLGLAWAEATQFASAIEKEHGPELTARSDTARLPTALRWFRRVAVLLLAATALTFVAASFMAADRPDAPATETTVTRRAAGHPR
jgi:hypothetical protein